VLALTFVTVSLPRPAFAQSDLGWFLAGAATSLGVHEGGHVIFAYQFDADPGLQKVSFGPFPFFALTHEPVSPAREFTISSAGFWTQHLSNELILTRRPGLRHEDAPFIKGMLAFNVLASAGYAAAAFARAGPLERDTRGIAVSARMSEPAVGAMILVPAALDAMRYYAPERRWLAWASRAAKVAGVLMVIRAAD
jgi:hypothetical protein